MDINTVRGLSTVFVLIAFIGVCWWAFSPKRKKKFDEAANLPFADEEQSQQSARKESEQNRGE
ncbi:cbb3-type cytochrome oxidase subunit 3 [Agaribacterium sp. ZY112]|uniref:cbb3-type cytochrome oxidase subunit 3 n=1 Tax=Agaribacterium sp. ZY112 TaxID=3233574 RepID=UPI00352337DC